MLLAWKAGFNGGQTLSERHGLVELAFQPAQGAFVALVNMADELFQLLVAQLHFGSHIAHLGMRGFLSDLDGFELRYEQVLHDIPKGFNKILSGAGSTHTGISKRQALKPPQPEIVLEQEDVPEDGCCEEQGVNAVEDAAVAGEHGAGIFDARAAFDGGFEKVAGLGGYVEDDGEQQRLPEGLRDVEEEVVAGGEGVADKNDGQGGENTAEDGGDGPFRGLAGAKARGQLPFAEGAADVERGDIARPDADHEEEEEGWTIFPLPHERDEGKRVGDVNEPEEALRGVGQDLDEGSAEAVPGKERESECAENGELRLNGEVGQGDDEGEGGAESHPPSGDAKAGVIDGRADGGELEVLKGGELGNESGGEGDHPELAEEDEGKDEEDEDESGKDAFHVLWRGYSCRGLRLNRRCPAHPFDKEEVRPGRDATRCGNR